MSDIAPEAIKSHLHTLILGRTIAYYPQVGSTNDLAREAGRKGDPEGTVFVTDEQVAGRGRLGRVWTAPYGCCVLCSVLLRPRFAPRQAFYLTIAAALAIYRSCSALLGETKPGKTRPVEIKWPNDVLVRGRKVAGILCESEFGGEGWSFAIVGFGINANLTPGQLGPLASTATSLYAELGHDVDRAELLARVLTELESLYLSLQSGQFGYVLAEWSAALETLGRSVSVQVGDEVITGKALRVDGDGALVVRTGSGEERRILAGDVGIA